MKIAGKSFVIGTLITLVLFGLGYLAVQQNQTDLSYILYWQGWCLGMLMPCNNVGTIYFPVCEQTVWHVLAFYAGIPLGILVYSALAYFGLALFRRRN